MLGTMNVCNKRFGTGAEKWCSPRPVGRFTRNKAFPAPESHVTNPLSPYGISNQLCGEHYLSCFQRSRRDSVVSLRYANVYGPRQDPGRGRCGGDLHSKMLNGEQPSLTAMARQTRRFCVCRRWRSQPAAMGQDAHKVYNVGTGAKHP